MLRGVAGHGRPPGPGQGCGERLQGAAAGITDRAPRLRSHGQGGDPVTADYVRVTGPADLFAKARELSVRTMILDVEPLVTPWRSGQESLDQGIASILGRIRTVPSVRVVV